MRITTWAEYGLLCSVHLARRRGEGPVASGDVAAREQLSADYVEQILLRLRRSGIVVSVRGAHGGYALARDPSEISVRDVIAAVEGVTFQPPVHSRRADADSGGDSNQGSVRPVWLLLQQRIDDTLGSIRLGDLLASESVVRERVGLRAISA